MKVNNLKAKDNFYSAETVLDEIRTAMGERVSASVGSAYELVLKIMRQPPQRRSRTN